MCMKEWRSEVRGVSQRKSPEVLEQHPCFQKGGSMQLIFLKMKDPDGLISPDEMVAFIII